MGKSTKFKIIRHSVMVATFFTYSVFTSGGEEASNKSKEWDRAAQNRYSAALVQEYEAKNC